MMVLGFRGWVYVWDPRCTTKNVPKFTYTLFSTTRDSGSTYNTPKFTDKVAGDSLYQWSFSTQPMSTFRIPVLSVVQTRVPLLVFHGLDQTLQVAYVSFSAGHPCEWGNDYKGRIQDTDTCVLFRYFGSNLNPGGLGSSDYERLWRVVDTKTNWRRI